MRCPRAAMRGDGRRTGSAPPIPRRARPGSASPDARMSLEAEPVLRRALGLYQVLPAQCASAAPASAGLRRFYGAILLTALDDAGIARRSGTGQLPFRATPDVRTQARRRATARALARRWLVG